MSSRRGLRFDFMDEINLLLQPLYDTGNNKSSESSFLCLLPHMSSLHVDRWEADALSKFCANPVRLSR